MIAATVTNAQSALNLQIDRATVVIKTNVEEAAQDALKAGQAAVQDAQNHARANSGNFVLSMTMMVPLVMLLGLMMMCNHVNLLAVVRLLPVIGLSVVVFAVLNLFNPGHSRG